MSSLFHKDGNIRFFDTLPPDILKHIILFADIPSISALVQLCSPKNGNISEVASDEKTWLWLVNARFNINASKRIRDVDDHIKPKLYGGTTWKDAYRVMARSNKMPKMKVLFRKKIIFGKGGAYLQKSINGSDATHTKKCLRGKRHEQVCALWVMLNHTEDCNLRTIKQYDDDYAKDIFNRHEETYIEVQVGLQNTRSGFTTLHIDLLEMKFQMMPSDKCSDKLLNQPIIKHGIYSPRIIYRSIGENVNTDCSFAESITLKPFEFAVVAVSVPLAHYIAAGENLQFETDFLSRALTISVPVRCQFTEKSTNTICIGAFVSEHEIWENYMELPGNIVTLIDKTQCF
jgi:hypothetical protein